MSQSVSTTHGSFCSLFNQTLAGFETVRGATGACVQQVDGQLAESLRKAAGAYLDTDEGAAGVLSKFFR
ncbi:type VII secretion target [Mycobacterium kansasii]|uniref:type VII secretion target n=1 Tax=Mycobacterium kansasii TaxID=1768 RepID=UPI0027E54D78|nr:type VII secretion target [Mycobacterium kansasii]